jgi:ABC-2 type transport system ATP-binding protein
VRIDGLCKQFGDVKVVDGFGLTLAPGTITTVVGKAKTTVLAMVAGLLPPDDGSVRVFGVDVWDDEQHAKRVVASTPLDGGTLDGNPTAWAALLDAGRQHRLDPEETVVRAWHVLTQVGLADVATLRLGDHTPGMHSRLMLARALLGRPALLVLDDPFRGVDEASARRIRAVLEGFAAAGGTVLLSGDRLNWTRCVTS